MIETPFTHNDYEITQREELYKGVFRLARYHVRHKLFNGNWSNTYTREVYERKSAVAILPYDPILNQVVLIEQFRAGALSNPKNPWLIEIVAGLFDKDESPETVARRESIEEAGCDILDVHPICQYFVSPGGSNEHLHLFIGRVDASQIGGMYGLKVENEDIRAFTLPLEDAVSLLNKNSKLTSPVIISLLWLQLNREKLKQLWQVT
jgi:ADP-ribose pyrophosphatase